MRIEGRVQGVSFRWYTVREAERLGLSGWVRNLPDGAVLLEAEGPEPALEALAAWCRRGPSSAQVTRAVVSFCEAIGEADGFRIER